MYFNQWAGALSQCLLTLHQELAACLCCTLTGLGS